VGVLSRLVGEDVAQSGGESLRLARLAVLAAEEASVVAGERHRAGAEQLAVALRLARKRELAQLNSLDFIVLLAVANAVQNSIIGDDDSVTGGVLGASALFVLNGALAVVLFRRPKLRRLTEGTPRTLISMGVVDHEALRKERLTQDQLMAAIATQGAGGLDDVAEAVLVPNGTIVTRMKEMDRDAMRFMDLTKQLDELKAMVAGLGPASAGPQRSA
jgi:uncharacterized membrane protein YcaP (DUF421 family)